MLKKSLLTFGAVAMVLTAVSYVSAQAKPQKGVLVGTVVEISSYAMKGLGEDTIEGHKSRAEHGFPVGLIEDETGVLWVCTFRSSAPASHLETANKHLAEYMGQKVAMQGQLYRAKGANVIRMSVVSEY